MHWNFGQGTLLTRCASVMMLLSFVAGTAALVFLWVLYPREVDYDRAADLSLEFLNAQRSGKLRQGFPIDWRFDSGLQVLNPRLLLLILFPLCETLMNQKHPVYCIF